MRSLSAPWTTNHHKTLLLPAILVLRLTRNWRLLGISLEMVATIAPAEQVGTVPHILLAPSTLTLELESWLRRGWSDLDALGGLTLSVVAAILAEFELVVEAVVSAALAYVRLGGMDVFLS